MFSRRQPLSADEARRLAPARAPLAETRQDGADLLLTVHRSPGRLTRVLAWFFTLPPTRTIRLDAFGARVWNMCDGRTSVGEIAAALAHDHGWPADRAEHAVLTFLMQLSDRKLIGFPPARERAGAADGQP